MIAIASAMLLAGAMALAAILDISAFSALREADAWRTHTWLVLRDADRLRDLTPGLRTGGDNSRLVARDLIAKLRIETKDNLRQQRNIARLSEAFDVLTVSVKRRDHAEAVVARSDDFNRQLSRVAAEEDRLLSIRTHTAAQAERRALVRLWIVVTALALGAGAVLWSVIRLGRSRNYELSERLRLQDEVISVGILLRGIVDATPGLIFAKDRDGRFLLANPTTLELLGQPWDVVKGRTDAEILQSKKEGLAVMANDRRIMASGVAETMEEVVSAPDGTPREWLSTKAPLRGASDEVIGIVGLSVDITDRKQAETRLQELQSQLTQLARLGAMGELSLALAHELNQPLATIVNHLSIAEHQVTSGAPLDRQELAGRLVMASDQTMRAGDIVKRLRAFAENDKTDHELELLSGLVLEAKALISGAAQRRNVEIAVNIERRDIRVSVNRVQLQQVVVSLLQDALETVESDVGRRVDVTVGMGDNALAEVLVHYGGEALDHQQRENVYRRFSTAKMSNAGVGMAICRRIVENHGGRLDFITEGGGTKVSISLPLA